LDDECAIELSKGVWNKLSILRMWENEIGNRGLNYLRKANWPILNNVGCSIKFNSLNALRYIASSNWRKGKYSYYQFQ
jgi:hypothetical protein